jgi:methionyl-tRNA formyltransferase
VTGGSAPGRAAGPVRTIFFGSGPFAVPILDAVAVQPELLLVAVLTAPDRPAGRAAILTPTPVAVRARDLGLPILQPPGVRSPEVVAELAALAPALGILADYGRIIPPALLDLPTFGILGVHPSLLPRHRGATPIQATILEGDAEAGVTIYRMDAGLDTGPVLLSRSWALHGTEAAPELEAEAAKRGASLLTEALPAYLDGRAEPRPQAPAPVITTTRLTRDLGRLDPSRTAVELERQVRAYAGWPGSFVETVTGRLGVLAAFAAAGSAGDVEGVIVQGDDGRPAIGTAGGGRLVLERVQPAGGRPMDGADFLRGHLEVLGTTVAPAATVVGR